MRSGGRSHGSILNGSLATSRVSSGWTSTDLYLAGDKSGFGKVSGEFLASMMPDGGDIVVFRGIPTTIDNERVDAVPAAMDGSGINVLDMEHGNWNRDDSFTVMHDVLSKYPRIDALWVSDDPGQRHLSADSVEKQPFASAEYRRLNMARAPFLSGFLPLLRCRKDLCQFAEVPHPR